MKRRLNRYNPQRNEQEEGIYAQQNSEQEQEIEKNYDEMSQRKIWKRNKNQTTIIGLTSISVHETNREI